MESIKSKYRLLSIEHGKAIDKGDYKKANKLHDKITGLYSLLKSKSKLVILEELFGDDNDSVKLWSATHSLVINENEALRILKEIKNKSSKIEGLTASTTLHMWSEKLLNL